VIAVEEDVELSVGRRRQRFARVAHERCLACGERIFGIEASQRFDAMALRRRSAARPGASERRTRADPNAAVGRARVSRRTLDAADAQTRARRAIPARRVQL
jgi:hypothetical protein